MGHSFLHAPIAAIGVSAGAGRFGILGCGLEVPAGDGQAAKDTENEPDDYPTIHEPPRPAGGTGYDESARLPSWKACRDGAVIRSAGWWSSRGRASRLSSCF
jgi:hypothetical protein